MVENSVVVKGDVVVKGEVKLNNCHTLVVYSITGDADMVWC